MKTLDQEIKKQLGSLSPLLVLKRWLDEALQIPHLKEPWAMFLSTGNKREVSSRVVLLKQLQKGELFFYTNYLSAKAKDIKTMPFVAVNFYWPQLDRQLRIQGKVRKTSRKKSQLYWKTRSRDSQISQWLSQQSQAVSSRKQLEELRLQTERHFQNKNIPCPKHWGGYAVLIKSIEFWINRKHRLHDRFLFEKTGRSWKKQRLFP